MGIGKKLDELMKQRGTNANELAQKIGVAPTTIYSMIRRDSKKADIEVLLRIANELGVKAEFFCDDENISNSTESNVNNIELLIARNGKKMSDADKLRLIKLLSELK